MNLDKEKLSTKYSLLSDEEIEEMVLYEAKDFMPEALSVLKNEVRKRSLPQDLQKIIDVQLESSDDEISTEEAKALMSNIYSLPCPLCGNHKNSINAFETMTVKSFIIFTSLNKSLLIGCPDCILSAAKRALIITILFGWWGIPWGFIKTPQAIFLNLRSLLGIKNMEPSNVFTKLVKDNASYIKANINSIEKLNELLVNPKFIRPRQYDLRKI